MHQQKPLLDVSGTPELQNKSRNKNPEALHMVCFPESQAPCFHPMQALIFLFHESQAQCFHPVQALP